MTRQVSNSALPWKEQREYKGYRVAWTVAPSAASRRADRQRAIRHGERPASVAEQRVAAVGEGRAVAPEHPMAAVAGIINQGRYVHR
ncbi:MAG TPA: hypothetical protein VKM93_19315 [Terriglobia bacterium]|nr:hypothetical protein [Terriglobia bacterium]